jgi:hypothetical protein
MVADFNLSMLNLQSTEEVYDRIAKREKFYQHLTSFVRKGGLGILRFAFWAFVVFVLGFILLAGFLLALDNDHYEAQKSLAVWEVSLKEAVAQNPNASEKRIKVIAVNKYHERLVRLPKAAKRIPIDVFPYGFDQKLTIAHK